MKRPYVLISFDNDPAPFTGWWFIEMSEIIHSNAIDQYAYGLESWEVGQLMGGN